MTYHKPSLGNKRLHFNIPLLDFTYQGKAAKIIAKQGCGHCTPTGIDYLESAVWPSMKQAQLWTVNYYNAAHWLIKMGVTALFKPYKKPKKRNWYAVLTIYGLVFALDYTTNAIPLGITWSHEEFHRNNLTVNGIYNFNDLYNWEWSENVTRVKDEDLMRLKRENNGQLVRAHASGCESDLEMVTKLQKENFFYGLDLPHYFMYLYGTLSFIIYIRSNHSADVSEGFYANYYYPRDGDDVSKRDYVGQDFTAWVYDLHRPNEPYTSRGRHPLGLGIDRYITYQELDKQERNYLGAQGNLSLLNLMTPFLLGVNAIRLSDSGKRGTWYGNFHVRHHLTSFGNNVELGVFLRNDVLNLLLSAHAYANKHRAFPGVGIEILDYAVKVANYRLVVSAELAYWVQPRKGEFYAKKGVAGMFFNTTLEFPLYKGLRAYAEFETKTDGWVAAHPYLSQNTNFRIGLNLFIN